MKTLIIFISILFSATYMYAQTNYYATTKTFNQDGYIYQCDVRASGFVTLYNKSNKLINVYPVYKNTGESFAQTDAGIELFEDDNWTSSKCKSIVNAAFSDSEKQRIKGYDFNIKMYINSSTGRVDEVSFEFHRSGPFATIPVSVYRKIETEIKKELWFTLTAEGKMLSYIFYWWAQEPK